MLIQIQGLQAGCRNGFNIHTDRIIHIEFGAFPGKDILDAALAGHLVCQRNAFGFGGEDYIMLRHLFQKLSSAGNGQFYVGKHDEGGNGGFVIDGTQRQLPGKASHP